MPIIDRDVSWKTFEKQQESINLKYESRVGKSLEEATIRIVVVRFHSCLKIMIDIFDDVF